MTHYTQHESDLETIRRRWSSVSSNDIGLTEAQRVLVTDFEVVLEMLDEHLERGSKYKDPSEVSDLLGALDKGAPRDEIREACDDAARALSEASEGVAADLLERLAKFLVKEEDNAPGSEDVGGYPRPVAGAIELVWRQRDDDAGHRADFALCGWRGWLADYSDGRPCVVVISPDFAVTQLGAEDVEELRGEL